MAVNRGKQFERNISDAFKQVAGVSIDRIPDQTTRYKGSTNICDFVVYREPYEYYFECKTVHGNTLSIYSNPKKDKKGDLYHFYGNISDSQWRGLLTKSEIQGVCAGIICWWVDKDVTMFLPIQMLRSMRLNGGKSVRYDCLACNGYHTIPISGKKKRVFFDYDMEDFLNELSKRSQEES